MYEVFFKFNCRPFLPTPQANRYFPAAAIESAHQNLVRSIERAEGAGLLVGPAGTGKSLLCHMLAHEFDEQFAAVLLAGGRLATRTALLQAIFYELGLPYRGLDEGELRLSLMDFLEPSTTGKAGLLLLIDEAHTLPLRLLEDIRMLTNLVRNGEPRVRVVLAGSPLLEERFASAKMSSFAQRLAARCYLGPLGGMETSAYVRFQIAAVGGDPDRLVDEAALASIYRASEGIPRLVNQLCDHALMLAALGGASSLSSEAIEEAWADLQQLPTPFNASSRETNASDVVEFGDLDDSSDDAPKAIPFRPTMQPLHVARTDERAETIGDAASAERDEPHASGLGGTEVDLDFPEFADTFAEQFEEEEVVLDRYASEVEIFADVPRVTSWEGRQLAALLGPLDAPSTRPDPTTVKFVTIYPQDEPQSLATPPVSALVGPDIVCAPPAGFTLSGETIGVDEPAATIGASSAFWAGARRAAEDRDLIIVEVDVSPPAPQPPRKREYRQLFAKLRRG